MSRDEKIAKIKRDLSELRTRILRIQGEAFGLEQQLRDVDLAVTALATDGDHHA